MRPIFAQLSNVAMETGAAIVLVGHMNKNESAKGIPSRAGILSYFGICTEQHCCGR